MKRLLARFRRPAHIARWGGGLIDPWAPCWDPSPFEIR